MPKANEKDAYYFSHDSNARNDPKMLALRSVHGAEGYGVYFMLVEILREQPEYRLPVTKYLWNTLAMQMQVQAETLEIIINDCCTEFTDGGSTLLVNDGKYLYTTSLLRRMGKVDDISVKRKAAAEKSWENRPCKVPCGDDGCNQDANAEQEQPKEKKRKENQSKPEQRKEKKTKADKSNTEPFAAFAGDDDELLAALHGFDEMRKKIKKPMTDEAKRRALMDLEKLSIDRDTQIAILHQSEDKCWLGVFAIKDQGSKADGYRTAGDSGSKMDALRELHQEFSEEG